MKLKKKKHSIRWILFCFTMFLIGIYSSFQYLQRFNVSLNMSYNNFLLDREYSNHTVIQSFSELLHNKKEEVVSVDNQEGNVPIIYIYNTHQSEEYAKNNLFSFSPNVTMVDYILENHFNKNHYTTIVEERSIKDILNTNSWNYAASYVASRILLEDAKKRYSSLEYFIDVHRDSLPHDRTTITINDKDYARILFIVGLENESYQSNFEFTQRISDKLNEKYPEISKGILQKGGIGVNGIYNQDFSPKTILVEMGGNENTTYEVLNSTLAFAECFLEVIRERED